MLNVLTTVEAAGLLGIRPDQMAELLESGQIPYFNVCDEARILMPEPHRLPLASLTVAQQLPCEDMLGGIDSADATCADRRRQCWHSPLRHLERWQLRGAFNTIGEHEPWRNGRPAINGQCRARRRSATTGTKRTLASRGLKLVINVLGGRPFAVHFAVQRNPVRRPSVSNCRKGKSTTTLP